jgi:hypothetical protein
VRVAVRVDSLPSQVAELGEIVDRRSVADSFRRTPVVQLVLCHFCLVFREKETRVFNVLEVFR